jgi:hypothetical protein
VLINSITEAMAALAIPFFFLGIFVLLFASMMFFIEGQRGTQSMNDGHFYDEDGVAMTFRNIPHTMYFMMVTMTTTGYGDQYPSTTPGKLLAAIAAVFGILFLAMPLTIVGNSFYNNWNSFLAKQEKERVRKEMLKRRREYTRRTLMSSDLRNSVEKLVVANTEPGPPAKKMDGTQRDILGAYLTLMHLSNTMSQLLSSLLARTIAETAAETAAKTAAETAAKEEKELAKCTPTPSEGESKKEEDRKEMNKNDEKTTEFAKLQKLEEQRGELKHLKDLMLDVSVNSAVFGSVLGKGTKTKGRKGSMRLLKDVSRRVLVQVKLRRWASLYGRSADVAKNADMAEQHLVRLLLFLSFSYCRS